jgi:hypothetical protein
MQIQGLMCAMEENNTKLKSEKRHNLKEEESLF